MMMRKGGCFRPTPFSHITVNVHNIRRAFKQKPTRESPGALEILFFPDSGDSYSAYLCGAVRVVVIRINGSFFPSNMYKSHAIPGQVLTGKDYFLRPWFVRMAFHG